MQPKFSSFQEDLLSLKHAFQAGLSAPLPGGIGYCKGLSIHADQIHLGQIAEGDHRKSLAYLESEPLPESSIYLGVGGLLNLSYIAKLKPARAVLFDVNPLQTLFWDQMIHHFKSSNSRDCIEFLKASQDIIKKTLRQNFAQANLSTTGCETNFTQLVKSHSPLEWEKGFFRGLAPDIWLTGIHGTAHEWMSEANYRILHELACDEKIDAITLDILDTERCRKLGALIASESPDCGTIYINSLRMFLWGHRDWTGRHGLDATEVNFEQNIKLLLPEREQIIIEDKKMIHAKQGNETYELRF